ncbi:MAG: MATE family efflux transporter [Methylomarinum sp.]|nr:MATE family efflux transporter [Methylomarinum sp.]
MKMARKNNQINARFVSGSTMQHILVMTSTSTLGLMAVFLVDLTDMYFLSLLGEQAIAAAIGFAGSIAFFTTSICIALSIAAGVKISREIGSGESDQARSSTTNIAVIAGLVTLSACTILWPNIEFLLRMLGARGQTLTYAIEYLQILLPSMPLLALGMVSAGALRALGDAKRAMICTLVAGMVNLVLDPLFIFQFGFGVKGAAIASVCARVVLLWIAAYGVIRVHGLIARFDLTRFRNDFRQTTAIAIPALLTNIATPVGSAFITRMISGFGDSYIAAFAVIGRVIPVAFAMIFALSGAIGSIIGQNYGAGFFDRVKQVQNNALLFATAYTMLACLIVWLSTTWISNLFNLQIEATALFSFYWTFISWTYLFLGAQFIANASFNNLGKPFWSTVSNWGRILFGTIPLAWFGAKLLGVYGVLIGEAIGTVLIGSISIWVSRRLINNLHSDMDIGEAGRATAMNPLSSGIAATGVVSSHVAPRNIDKQNHPSQN